MCCRPKIRVLIGGGKNTEMSVSYLVSIDEILFLFLAYEECNQGSKGNNDFNLFVFRPPSNVKNV